MSRVRSGFTLLELLVALVLTAVLTTGTIRMLLAVRRSTRALAEQVTQQATLREAATVLVHELRPLSAGSPPETSTLVGFTPTSVSYRAVRSLHFVCRAVPRGARTVVIGRENAVRSRGLDPQRDSALIFARASNPADPGQWVAVDVRGVAGGACPDGRPALRVDVSPVASAVDVGSPFLGVQMSELRLYRDRTGSRWIGMRTAAKTGGWNASQPVVGPVHVGGLLVLGFDAQGAVTGDPARVVRLAARVTAAAVVGRPRAMTIQVALRNAP